MRKKKSPLLLCIALQQMGTVGATIQELEGLSIGSDEGTAPGWVDFVAAVGTELDLHGGRLSGKRKKKL